MTAWETLIDKSTIVSGNAWEHLLAQGGGTIAGTQLVDSFSLEIDMTEYELSIEDVDFVVELESTDFSIEIDEPSYELEIENG